MGALSRQAADRATCGGVAFGKEVDVLREGAGPPPQVAPQTRRLRVEREEPRFLGHRHLPKTPRSLEGGVSGPPTGRSHEEAFGLSREPLQLGSWVSRAGAWPESRPELLGAVGGVGAGLQNLGNTCYVNAALQCLSHTPPLASWMVSQQHATLCPARSACTLCAMRAHVTRALLHAGEVIRPRKDLLAGFHRHQQEDAHEFLMFTLNAMQQGCLSASQPSGHASEDTTVIRQIFGGTWRSQIQCLRCLGVSDTFDPYLDISLDITAAQSVEQALRELVKPEKLDADNAYDCGVCLRKVPATKRLTLHSTSQVLVLVLKRFTPVSGAKRAQEVRYPQCLDLQPYTSERKAGPLGYVLYAVLVHSGWSCERGHYFCYVRAGNGQWYKMDDAKVTACDETAALSQSAYVLFYAREGAWEGGAGGGAAAPVGADPTDPGQPAADASGRAPGSEESPGDTEVEGMSLEQWRRLQEHSRPKPALELRKVQSALPAGAVVIHQSKYGGGRNRTPPQQEHERLDRPSTDTPPRGPKNVGNGPCASGRARATKGKNKKPRPSLGLWRVPTRSEFRRGASSDEERVPTRSEFRRGASSDEERVPTRSEFRRGASSDEERVPTRSEFLSAVCVMQPPGKKRGLECARGLGVHLGRARA
ncbi:ubiquitin carboxyl-terminal hydrolase 17-like protein 13 [Bos indicus]|uniref:Ubiquitin carboxyl-terminal hydrolase n=1 Tax=Bos indicus TaxID=9915 RepID=A0ABM4RRH6_BOSIN